ncbi:MAG TPA: YdcF family protein [Rickettsiales bacterium]|nr:YdcF family protein [Rickettsiales bacterium]
MTKKQIGIVLGLIWGIACLSVTIDGLFQQPASADLIVVLGNEVYKNGEPSTRLQARLNAALDAYKLHLAPLIMVSGGVGKSGYDEATVMANYLRQHGIKDSDIIIDSHGDNTRATALNTVKVMQEKHLHSALVVSQYFHLPRCLLAFRQEGITQVSATYPVYFEVLDVYGVTREAVGLLAYYLRLK